MKILKVIVAILLLFLIGLFLFILKITAHLLAILKIGPILCINRQILTPIVYLSHPQTGRQIILMGVMHIANKEYYMQLQQILDGLDGYKILYEGIGKITEEERLLFTEEETIIYERIQEHMQKRTIITALLKLQGQRDGLRYDDSWIRTDMTFFEFVKNISRNKLDLFKSIPKLKINPEGKSFRDLGFKWLLDVIFIRMSVIIYIVKFLNLFSSKKGRGYKLLVTERNSIALEAIFRESKNYNTASIWGAAHLPHMVKVLKRAGFKQEKKDWLVGYKIQKNNLKEMLASKTSDSKSLNSTV